MRNVEALQFDDGLYYVDGRNNGPNAFNDTLKATEDVVLKIAASQLLANDRDFDGDHLRIVAVGAAGHGQVKLNGDGSVTYTANANYNGQDSFSYTISDGQGGTSTAVVTVNITAVNDAPVAVADSYAIDEDHLLTVAAPAGLLANDSDVDHDALRVASAGTFTTQLGATVVLAADGSFTYDPRNSAALQALNDGQRAVDRFNYAVSDGHGGTATATASITVTGINENTTNHAPVAVDDFAATNEDVVLRLSAATLLANDTDPDAGDTKTLVSVQGAVHGTVAFTGGQVVFTPTADYFGDASFTYTMQDRTGARSTATVHVTVNPVNDAAVLSADTRPLTEGNSASDISASGQLTIHDIDSPETFNAQTNTAGAYGRFSLAANGAWTYAANSAHDEFVQGQTYTDRFDVTSADGTHTSVTIQIRGTDDAAVLAVPAVAAALDVIVANQNDGVGVLAGDGHGAFAAPISVATGGLEPVSVAVGDINADGELDIVTANFGTHDVSVLLGDGFGTFELAGPFPTGATSPRSIALGDLDGDGRLDIVTANSDVTNSVSVLLNAGGFAATMFESGGAHPAAVTAGDLNRDGRLDVVVANIDSDNVGVLLGTGGDFAAVEVYESGGANPDALALGDLDSDGDLDIVVANLGSADVGVLLGVGDGSFATPAAVDAGAAGAVSTALGDLNGDGDLDIALANAATGEIVLLFGDGSGAFAAPVAIASGSTSPTSVAIGDLNDDGRNDLVASDGAAAVNVLLGAGGGSFAAPVPYLSGGSSPVAVVLADIVDPASLTYVENQARTAITPALSLADVDSTTVTGARVAITGGFHAGQDVLGFTNTPAIHGAYNSATGVLTLTGSASLAAYQAALRSVTYFNSSQDPSSDLRTVSYQTGGGTLAATVAVVPVNDAAALSSATVNLTETDAASSLRASGTLSISDVDSPALFVASEVAGDFGTFAITESGGWSYTPFSAHDEFVAGVTYTDRFEVLSADGTSTSVTINMLGTNDAPRILAPSVAIITVNQGTDDVTIIAGDGRGGFLPGESVEAGGIEPRSAALGDLNGDGKLDIVVANHASGTLGILEGNGAGDFSLAATLAAEGAYAVQVGDVNGDGNRDILASNLEASTIIIFVGDGAGGFTELAPVPTGGSYPYSFAIGDVDTDGRPDLAVSNWINSVQVLIGDGSGGFSTAGSFAHGSAPYSVALGDIDGDTRLDLVFAQTVDNTVGVLLGDGTGAFTAAGSFASGGEFPYQLRLADVSADGRLDIVVANASSNTVGVLLGDGAGGFSDAVAYDSGGGSPTSVDVGDVNGDGRIDILAGNFDSSNVGVLYGDGAGGFAAPLTVATNGNPNGVVFANIGGGGSITYPSTHPPLAVNPALRVDDVDSAMLASAAVAITGNFHAGQDVLGFSDTTSIHGTYNPATGVLTLTGTDTVANYQAALRSVTYFNPSPAPSTDVRIVSFQVDDGAATRHASNVATTSVVVQGGLTVTGGSGADALVGSVAGDVLTGNGGDDLLTGLGGADRFVYRSLGDALDTITDFDRAEGDKLDIRDLLVGYTPGSSVLANFVGLSESGGDTTVSVNADGLGTDVVPLVTLHGVTGSLTALDLLASGNLIVS